MRARERVKSDPVTLTSLLAFYGAALSSIALGWNLYRDLRDRARIRVKVHIRRAVKTPDGKWYQLTPDLPVQGASDKLYVVADVTNIGRRPVKCTGWGGTYHKPQDGKRHFRIVPSALPIMLKEGDSCSEMTDDLSAAGENVKALFIDDAADKRWYLSGRDLRRLKQEHQKWINS